MTMEELVWPVQSPDFNPTEHLWDEQECLLPARTSCPKPLLDLTTALDAEWVNPHSHIPLYWKEGWK